MIMRREWDRASCPPVPAFPRVVRWNAQPSQRSVPCWIFSLLFLFFQCWFFIVDMKNWCSRATINEEGSDSPSRHLFPLICRLRKRVREMDIEASPQNQGGLCLHLIATKRNKQMIYRCTCTCNTQVARRPGIQPCRV